MRKKTKQKSNIVKTVLFVVFAFVIPYIVINGLILFLFIQTPKIVVLDTDSPEYTENKITFTIDSLLPIINISTFYQDEAVPYTKFKNNYLIDAANNGTYKISIVSLNKAIANSYVDIETIDKEPPKIDIDNATIFNNILSFSIIDSKSDINYDRIYATTDDNNQVKPTNIDKTNNVVEFNIEENHKLIVHIEDVMGNYSETTFTAN